MQRPAHYKASTNGARCRCINLWLEADGSFWCCNREGGPTTEPVGDAIFIEGVDKFKSPAPLPTPHQAEGLTILMEEAFEILPFIGGRASKAIRFGLDEIQPGQSLTNRERLSVECGDFAAVVDLLVEAGAVDGSVLREAIFNKRTKLRKFLQFDPD